MTPVTIAGIPIGDGHPTRLCADIGTNHGGNLDLAMSLIRSAKQAGCDFVKGQKRCPELAVPEAEWNELRDTPWGKMPKLVYRHRVEFSQEQWTKLFDFAHSLGIVMFTSVWDIPSLECMERVISPCYKIPSARAHDTELIRAVAATRKPVIVSTGMSTMNDLFIFSRIKKALSRSTPTSPKKTSLSRPAKEAITFLISAFRGNIKLLSLELEFSIRETQHRYH